MADEIAYTPGQLRITDSNGDVIDAIESAGSVDVDLTDTDVKCASGIIDVSNSAHEALPLQDVSTPGWAVFRNKDTTNSVDIGTDDTGAFVKYGTIPPLCEIPWNLDGETPYAKFQTAAGRLAYRIYEK